ncbi:hypothetical protein T484DRAFT_1912185 [Baffinella frigidus]|nr:hypothetical protein T484DRAFT_1912185 [Cryptophyta sp. CCMP2293]
MYRGEDAYELAGAPGRKVNGGVSLLETSHEEAVQPLASFTSGAASGNVRPQQLSPRAALQRTRFLNATENPSDARESALKRLGSFQRSAYRAPWWTRMGFGGHLHTIIGEHPPPVFCPLAVQFPGCEQADINVP